MRLDLPILLIAIIIGTTLQELIPAIPYGYVQLKAQLLPAIALYYMNRREWPIALTAALWCGILTDATGHIPNGTTSFTLLFAAIIAVILRRDDATYSPYSTIPQAATLYLLLPIIQFIAIHLSSEAIATPPFLSSLYAILRVLPVQIILAIATDYALYNIDLNAGNITKRRAMEI